MAKIISSQIYISKHQANTPQEIPVASPIIADTIT
jgi:hypothetical protein